MLTSDRRRSDGSLQRGAPTAMNAIMALLNLRTVYPIYDVRDGDYPIDRTGRFLNTQYEHMCNINPDECNLVIRDARGNEIGRRDEWNFTKEIGDGGLGVSEYLRQQVANADRNIGNRPLIFLITSPQHATIFIKAYPEHGNSRIYTCGFGYQGELDENNTKTTAIAKANDKIASISNANLAKHLTAAVHHFERLKGAIYTPDHMLPNETHESRITWVGFLNNRILDSMQNFLDNAISIAYNGTIENYMYKFESSSVVLDAPYLEARAWYTDNNAFNCLEWAKTILGVSNLMCTFNNPANCRTISQTDFNRIIRDFDNAGGTLEEAVNIAQRNLTSLCSGESCSISGGKTRKKNRKNNKKTYRGKKRKHKSRR